MLLSYESITLKLRNPFRLSYGVSETRAANVVRLANDEGWGEGTIPGYYGISLESMQALWDQAARRTDRLPDSVDAIPAWVGLDGPAPARCALDLALHDRIARKQGVPLYRLLGLDRPAVLPTSFTIAIAEPGEMADLARQISAYPVIKVKLGSDDDEARLAAIRRARPDARLRIDANAGWTPEDAARHLRAWESFGLEMVEQPVEKHDFDGLGYVQAHTGVPVVADESVQTLDDIDRLARAGVAGINLKLQKVGGIAPALAMIRRARALGMKVMLGCMIETSVGTTAAAHLAGLADWLDLDAPMLITNDPFDGLKYDDHAGVHLPDRAGIGVERVGVQDQEPRRR
jgi:L-alanine-DL-glutamate epimerase-like enolase superfamily enzyme